jgi:serine/threonine protein kinase
MQRSQLILAKTTCLPQTQVNLCSEGVCASDRKLALIRFEQEAKISMGLRHPNVTYWFGVASVADCLWLVMERSLGSLDGFLRRSDPVPLETMKAWMKDVLAALCCCHDHGVCHLDVKPSNLLTFPRVSDPSAPLVKLCDFGYSEVLPKDGGAMKIEPKGSEMYAAPEVLTGVCTRTSDMFSFGIVFAELVFQRVIPAECRVELLSNVPSVYGPEHRLAIVNCVCSWLSGAWMEASTVLRQCVSCDPTARPSPETALCDLGLDVELLSVDSDSDSDSDDG